MKFIDLFAGIGGFRLAFEKAGFECVFSSEINKASQKTYFDNFGEVPYGDITKIDPNDIPDFDVLLGGFPCQPFSSSGKKLGFKDTRGTLFFNICEILKVKNPHCFILENVKNLVHHDAGDTFKTIMLELKELGYHVCYEILNARDFGVPQNRERIFIIGSKSGYFNFDKMKRVPHTNILSILEKDNDNSLDPKDYTIINNQKLQKSGLIFAGYINGEQRKSGVKEGSEHLSRAHRQQNRIYSANGVRQTLSSQETSGRYFVYIPHKGTVRKLTPTECYRVMGFPDSFKKHPSKTECYKQIGNTVCPPLIYEMAKIIKRIVSRKY